MKNYLSFACSFLLFCVLCFSSCSSIESIQGIDKAETYYLRGVAYLDESMFQEALEKFSLVKNKFPYSKYAVDSELKIGDTYYKKGDFMDAQRVYSLFAELRPQDPRRDYAIYQSGMCFYSSTPTAIDRDLSLANRGIQEFKTLIELYPSSFYFKDALERYTELRIRLAKKEIYIGDFYKKREKYEAAIARYKTVIENYSKLGFDDQMYYEIAKCYVKLANKDEANYYIDLLVLYSQDSSYAKKAKKLQRGL
jgi:outer membrane protein assembly factor BamD